MLMTQLFSMITLSVALLLLGKALSKKSLSDRELQSPFECGFSTLSQHRMSFSLHFFLVALVFAIFDVEILLLFPALTEAHSSLNWGAMCMYSGFIVLLTLGLVNEWNQHILEWSK